MSAYPYMPGVPAAGHISRGFWHPGGGDSCVKCDPPRRADMVVAIRSGDPDAVAHRADPLRRGRTRCGQPWRALLPPETHPDCDACDRQVPGR